MFAIKVSKTFHECNIFRSSRDYKVKMLELYFYVKTKTVIVHIDSSVYIFSQVAIDADRVVQKSWVLPVGSKSLKNTCDGVHVLVELHVEDRQQYKNRLLLWVTLTGFAQKYRTAANSRKPFWGTLFRRTLRADFFTLSNLLRKFWEYFNCILTFYCTASIRRLVLFPLTLKKTRLVIYVHIWLPRNSACALKHKQTWREQALYRAFAWDRISVFYNSFKSCKTFIWLYVNWKWIANFWSKISNTLGSKGYLIWNRNH